MSNSPNPNASGRSAFRMTRVVSTEETVDASEWITDFNVRGERVRGRLFVSHENEEQPAPFGIWLRGGVVGEPKAPASPTTQTRLELDWPLIGARHDVKLSPLLIRSVTEPGPSAAQKALWQRFSEQAALEVTAALAGLESQTDCPLGAFSELVLDLGFEDASPQQALRSASDEDPLDVGLWVRDFLSQFSPETEA